MDRFDDMRKQKLDDEVTETSSNGVKSSGVYRAINQKIQYGKEDLENGVTPLPTGTVYFVYEE